MGEIVSSSPRVQMLRPYPVTVFGDRACEEVINVK